MSFAAASAPHLASALAITRLTLHVLAAAIWVGGQFVLAGLLPTVRGLGEDAPRRIAQAFGRLSWPAYWVLIATGVWNYAAIDHRHATTSWNVVFSIKLAAVVVAGLGSYLHTRTKSASSRGAWAGVGTLGSVLALVLGVALAG